MSYILDALKKAESERHLGDVPSIHGGAPSPAAAGDTPAWRKILPWLVATALGLALLAYVLWSQLAGKPAAEPAAPVAAKPAAPAEAPVTPGVAPPVPVNTPVAIAPLPPVHESAPAASQTAVAARPAAAVTEKPAPAEKPPAETPVKPAVADTPAVPPDDEVGTVQNLPPSIQRELPQISVNGYIYARNPADRTVLINKRLMHEGESIAPDLVLEKMTPKGAILNYKGYRYRVAY